jgi:hypothetical protein
MMNEKPQARVFLSTHEKLPLSRTPLLADGIQVIVTDGSRSNLVHDATLPEGQAHTVVLPQ